MTLAHGEPRADAAGGVVDIVCLADGRTLTVRTVTEADVEGLNALFERLSEEDRYYRFFNLSHPGHKFLEQLTRVALAARTDRTCS